MGDIDRSIACLSLSVQVDLPLIPVTARSDWCQGFDHLTSLQRLDLVECRFVNDEAPGEAWAEPRIGSKICGENLHSCRLARNFCGCQDVSILV